MAASAALALLPDGYGFVLLVFVATIFMLQWMAYNVMRARKKFEVKYPTMYSDRHAMFNCIQRVHQNTLEGYPVFLVLMFFSGLQYPKLSAACGVIWMLGRIVYAFGYYSGDPEKRVHGAFAYIGLLTLLGITIKTAVSLISFAF